MIYKYDIEPKPTEGGIFKAELTIPFFAVFLDAQNQESMFGVGLKAWFNVSPTHNNHTATFKFYLIPTGEDPDTLNADYVKTMQLKGGLVYHVYLEEVRRQLEEKGLE